MFDFYEDDDSFSLTNPINHKNQTNHSLESQFKTTVTMKNSKRGPLSINVLFTTKMAILLLFLLPISATKAQLVLVKDINTPQIADLKNAVVYAVGNKLYYSDGTANGTKAVYTGAANATILSNSDIYQNQLLAYFFVEQTPTSAKALRYNKTRVEVLTEGTTVTHFMTYFGQFRYVVNGNQLWAATYNTGPTLIKTFASPIKELKDNFIFTTNSVWLIDYSLGTSTLLKDGFTDIGASNGSLFAANDGGFNGTELWTATSPPNAYMLRDLNPGTASSNPRNFLGNYFCATSEGQNWLYYYDYTNVKRLIAAPIGTEIKPISVFYGYSQYGQSANFIVYTEKTGSAFHVYAAQVDTPSIRTTLYAGTEGDVVFTPSLYNIFTHVHSNGTRDIWQFAYPNAAELIVPNASLDNQYGGLRVVAGDDGKLWRMEFDNTYQRYNRALIKDFGAAKLQIQGITTISTPSIYRSELIITSTLAGNTTTNTLNISDQIPSNIRDVATVTLPTSEYSSFPNSFVEINGKILFNATDGENGEELWRTDGTTAGTTLFKAFSEGPYGNVGKSFKDNGFVYFENKNLSGDKTTYWKTDGTTIDSIRSATAEFQTIKNKFNQGQTYPSLTVGNAKYQTYYATYPLCNRCPSAYLGGIQRIVGTDTSFVFSFSYVSNGALAISSLQPLGNKFYFTFHQILTSSDDAKRGALWGSDGTAAGTAIIKTFTKRPSDIVVVNNKMYFTADDDINGLALWTSDGTAAGTKVLANFPIPSPVPLDIEVSRIYVQGNSLYFILSQLYTRNGASLYGYRIGGNGMSKIMDLTNDYFAPAQNGIQVNGNLYLAQTNTTVGTELFKRALTEAPLGEPLSNQSDLALTQTVSQTRTADTLYLDFAITLKNNGSQTATNVKTTFPSLSSFGLYINSNAPLRDTILSAGFITNNYSTWLIESLGINQTATFTYRLVANKVYIQRKVLRTTTRADQFDGDISNNTAEYPIELTVESCTGPVDGKLLVDYYLNQITDASPIVIQNPDSPSGSYLTSGAATTSFSDQYIRRARGYLKPSETGNYRFYIAGDDNVDVYLSTDDNPANKQRIAYVQGYTSYTQFDKFPSQTSAVINLTAGRRYYVEIVNADKFGDDFFNLQWTTPSVSARNLIAAAQIESFCGNPVVVNLPDLTLENLRIYTPTVTSGELIGFRINAKNIGTASVANPILIHRFLSLDQILDANDFNAGWFDIPALSPGASRSDIVVNINSNFVVAGTYYIISVIDYDNFIAESNENNNVIVSTSTVTIRPNVTALPDLTLTNLRLSAATVQAGQRLGWLVDLKNIGSANVTVREYSTEVRAYISTDNVLSADDVRVDFPVAIYNIPANSDFPNSEGGANIPALFPAGTYFLILKIDDTDIVVESNENNNTLSSTVFTITGGVINGYCASKGVAPWEYAISNVTLNTMNNNSDKFKDFNTLGYSDFTNLNTTLTKGQSYPLSITPLLSWIGNLPNVYCRVWIDFNQNKTFEANELVLEKTNANPLTQSFTVPTTATLGNTRMRVSLKFGGYPTACETFDKGEVEDYTVQINEGTSGVNLPDLTLTSISNRTPSVQQGQNVYFNFDAKNIGTGNATNPFTIKSYLSRDTILDANDYQNGTIPTANYQAGIVVQVIQGALYVENTLAVGNYYLILKIDADNQIVESNENNNVIVSQNMVTVTAPIVTSNDIALSLTSTPSVYRQYTTQSFKITAKNTGNQGFTNVKIDFPFPAKTVNGGTVTASIGTWQEYCAGGTRCFTWTIPSLAANTTATLDVPLYILDVVNSLTATTHLLSANPVDNNTANNVATITINQQTGQIAPPLTQSLVQSKPTQLVPVVIQKINPTITENYIVVELESIVEKQIEFEIINSLGTIVLTEKMIIERGNNKRQFDVSNLPKGLYFIQTSVGKGRHVPTKFVKF